MDSAVMVEMKSDESSNKSEKMSYQEAPLPPPPLPVSLFEKINTQKKIIHTADIRFEVKDLKKLNLPQKFV